MDNYLITNANILTFSNDKKDFYIQSGALYVGRGTILDFGKEKDVVNRNSSVTDRIDAKGKIVMPGFVDLHNHLYSSLFHNIPVDKTKTNNFTGFMDNYWWKLTEKLNSDGVYYSAVKGLMNSIKSGVTTVFNMHSSPQSLEDSLFDIADAYEELSMRGVLAYEISNKNSDAKAERMLDINSQFIKEYQSNPLISGMLGLSTANEASDTLLKKIASQLKRTGSGLMLHLAESEDEDELSLKRFNKYSIDRLQEFGLLGPKTVLSSSNYLDETDADIILQTNSNIVLTPSSSFYKGLDHAPIDLYTKRRIPIGLGSDGIFSSIANETSFLHKIIRQEEKGFNSGNKDIFEITSKQSYEIANKFVSKSIGEIKLGASADFIIVDYIPEIEINENNLNSQFLYGILPARVSSTVVAGNFVMKDFLLTGVDEEEVNAKFQEIVKTLI